MPTRWWSWPTTREAAVGGHSPRWCLNTCEDKQVRWLLQGWRPDGVLLQLGQRSSDRDVWLWVPTGTSHNQSSPWRSALSLSQWKESNELHFITGLPPIGLQLVTGSADFIRNFPHMSAVGARQHPQQGPLLDPGSGGGGGDSGGGSDGGGSPGGSARPTSGLLWPRGI